MQSINSCNNVHLANILSADKCSDQSKHWTRKNYSNLFWYQNWLFVILAQYLIILPENWVNRKHFIALDSVKHGWNRRVNIVPLARFFSVCCWWQSYSHVSSTELRILFRLFEHWQLHFGFRAAVSAMRFVFNNLRQNAKHANRCVPISMSNWI